jgi:hypothetical protein
MGGGWGEEDEAALAALLSLLPTEKYASSGRPFYLPYPEDVAAASFLNLRRLLPCYAHFKGCKLESRGGQICVQKANET